MVDHPASAIVIRPARVDDVGFLVDCNAAMAWETEHKRLDHALLTRGVAAVFATDRHGFYLIAERAGERVGCLLITREWSDWRCGDWWWIQSVYVLEPARRSGVFRALHADVEQRAQAATGVVGLRLYVERENTRAQSTYSALGMVDAGYQMFEREFPPR
ncbi:MAG: GNAT family N-acetyltransferase [Dokdonella sp.]